MMRPYMAYCVSDDHRLYSPTKREVLDKRDRYILGHPRLSEADFVVFSISEESYREYLRNRDNPLWWILKQGDPRKELSLGRKNLLAQLMNIRKASVRC